MTARVGAMRGGAGGLVQKAVMTAGHLRLGGNLVNQAAADGGCGEGKESFHCWLRTV